MIKHVDNILEQAENQHIITLDISKFDKIK